MTDVSLKSQFVKTVQKYIYIHDVYRYICKVLTICHRQLPNVGMNDEVNYFSVRETVIRCKQKRLHVDDDGIRS